MTPEGHVITASDKWFAGLVVVDLALFLGGAATHAGIAIPLGLATWREPVVVPAVIVEGLGALALGAALAAVSKRTARWRTLAFVSLWFCFAGVLWGVGQGLRPMAVTTTSNDLLHITMVLVTTLALARLVAMPAAVPRSGGAQDEVTSSGRRSPARP